MKNMFKASLTEFKHTKCPIHIFLKILITWSRCQEFIRRIFMICGLASLPPCSMFFRFPIFIAFEKRNSRNKHLGLFLCNFLDSFVYPKLKQLDCESGRCPLGHKSTYESAPWSSEHIKTWWSNNVCRTIIEIDLTNSWKSWIWIQYIGKDVVAPWAASFSIKGTLRYILKTRSRCLVIVNSIIFTYKKHEMIF